MAGRSARAPSKASSAMRSSPLTAREPTPNRPRGTDEYRATRRRWGPPAGIRARGNTTMRMRTAIAAGVATGAAALVLGAVALTASGPTKAVASSHREAPLIANDPTADLTDFYLFPSPDAARNGDDDRERHSAGSAARGPELLQPRRLGALPLQHRLERRRQGRSHLDAADAHDDRLSGHVPLQHRPDQARSTIRTSACARRGRCGARRAMARASRSAPASRRPTTSARTPSPTATTPVRQQAITTLGDGTKVFVGPSEDPFAIDVGRIFDLIGVGGKGTDNLAGFNVHSIAIQVPLCADPPVGLAAGHRRLGSRRPHGRRQERRQLARAAQQGRQEGPQAPRPRVCEALGAGRAARSAADQRGHHPAWPQGLLELGRSRQGLPVREVLHRSGQAGPADPLAQRPPAQSAPDRRSRLASRRRPGRPAWHRRRGAPTSRRSCCGASSTRTTPRRRST